MSVNLYEKLHIVQKKLKAPKNQFNAFGKYKYRSLEDILEAVKPLLTEVLAFITISDEVVLIGDRYYVRAMAKFQDTEMGSGSISTTAYAREPLIQKGMNEPQITGSASSYARKYAVNGLLAIDDAKDADSTNKNGASKPKEKQQEIVDQAFFDFTTVHKDALANGFVFNKEKFTEAIIKHFKHLPTNKASIKKILKDVKPEEVIVETQPELPEWEE